MRELFYKFLKSEVPSEVPFQPFTLKKKNPKKILRKKRQNLKFIEGSIEKGNNANQLFGSHQERKSKKKYMVYHFQLGQNLKKNPRWLLEICIENHTSYILLYIFMCKFVFSNWIFHIIGVLGMQQLWPKNFSRAGPC